MAIIKARPKLLSSGLHPEVFRMLTISLKLNYNNDWTEVLLAWRL